MPFGMGSRTCIGTNISLLEMSKVIPVLVRDIDFELSQDKGQIVRQSERFQGATYEEDLDMTCDCSQDLVYLPIARCILYRTNLSLLDPQAYIGTDLSCCTFSPE